MRRTWRWAKPVPSFVVQSWSAALARSRIGPDEVVSALFKRVAAVGGEHRVLAELTSRLGPEPPTVWTAPTQPAGALASGLTPMQMRAMRLVQFHQWSVEKVLLMLEDLYVAVPNATVARDLEAAFPSVVRENLGTPSPCHRQESLPCTAAVQDKPAAAPTDPPSEQHQAVQEVESRVPTAPPSIIDTNGKTALSPRHARLEAKRLATSENIAFIKRKMVRVAVFNKLCSIDEAEPFVARLVPQPETQQGAIAACAELLRSVNGVAPPKSWSPDKEVEKSVPPPAVESPATPAGDESLEVCQRKMKQHNRNLHEERLINLVLYNQLATPSTVGEFLKPYAKTHPALAMKAIAKTHAGIRTPPPSWSPADVTTTTTTTEEPKPDSKETVPAPRSAEQNAAVVRQQMERFAIFNGLCTVADAAQFVQSRVDSLPASQRTVQVAYAELQRGAGLKRPPAAWDPLMPTAVAGASGEETAKAAVVPDTPAPVGEVSSTTAAAVAARVIALGRKADPFAPPAPLVANLQERFNTMVAQQMLPTMLSFAPASQAELAHLRDRVTACNVATAAALVTQLQKQVSHLDAAQQRAERTLAELARERAKLHTVLSDVMAAVQSVSQASPSPAAAAAAVGGAPRLQSSEELDGISLVDVRQPRQQQQPHQQFPRPRRSVRNKKNAKRVQVAPSRLNENATVAAAISGKASGGDGSAVNGNSRKKKKRFRR